jgi:regulator of sirC expression with transglutaminase-like and TPR domain
LIAKTQLLKENKEISALLTLIDDPDEEVYSTVSNRLISFGKDIIPNLESLWEHTSDETIQARIELMIHQLHYRDLANDFDVWKNNSHPGLIQGALLTARYHYPDIQSIQTMQDLEKMRRNIWLELNNYLTPLEQANVVSSILYNYHKQTGVEIAYDQPEDFFINKTIETKRGNAISNGILYLSLCYMLDIPVRAINIPRQFILAYVDTQYGIIHPESAYADRIKFFIDPLNGQIYSHQDVEGYFKRININPVNAYFRELDNKEIIRFLLEELSKCFDNDLNIYKMNELRQLAKLLEE